MLYRPDEIRNSLNGIFPLELQTVVESPGIVLYFLPAVFDYSTGLHGGHGERFDV
jgi:hypothetical protein